MNTIRYWLDCHRTLDFSPGPIKRLSSEDSAVRFDECLARSLAPSNPFCHRMTVKNYAPHNVSNHGYLVTNVSVSKTSIHCWWPLFKTREVSWYMLTIPSWHRVDWHSPRAQHWQFRRNAVGLLSSSHFLRHLIRVHLSLRRWSTFTRGLHSNDNNAVERRQRREGGSLEQNMHEPEKKLKF